MAYVDADKFAEEICNFPAIDEDSANAVISLLRRQPTADVEGIPEGGIGNLSDGYHTFNELYHHRAILFSVICNIFSDKAWKSKLHDTGDMFDGMFIVGIETPNGQATYHYDIEPYWDMFKVKELERAPKWDGHTPTDAIERIRKLSNEMKHGRWKINVGMNFNKERICLICGEEIKGNHWNFCSNCGAKMDAGKEK